MRPSRQAQISWSCSHLQFSDSLSNDSFRRSLMRLAPGPLQRYSEPPGSWPKLEARVCRELSTFAEQVPSCQVYVLGTCLTELLQTLDSRSVGRGCGWVRCSFFQCQRSLMPVFRSSDRLDSEQSMVTPLDAIFRFHPFRFRFGGRAILSYPIASSKLQGNNSCLAKLTRIYAARPP